MQCAHVHSNFLSPQHFGCKCAPSLTAKCSNLKANRDSSVGIATHYGLDGPRIEFLWETILTAPVQTGPVDHPASYTTGTGSLPGVKRPGRCVDHAPPSNAEVKERIKLYLYCAFIDFMACYGLKFTFTFIFTFKHLCTLPTRNFATCSAFVPRQTKFVTHTSAA